MRASIAAETAGVPSVSIVCQGFEGQATATGRGHGLDGMPLAVTVGHVDAQSTEEMVANFVATTVDQVVAGLTGSIDVVADADVSTPTGAPAVEPVADFAALDVAASGTLDDVLRVFVERGWSDGSPIVPPTRERVERFLAATGHDPWRTLGTAASSGRDITIWSIAVNAVMAGCDPAHLPILIAAAEILADPHYGAEHSGNTTGADALMILDGPAAAELGFNCGVGALRDGTAANTTVGRWLRLYLRNVFDFTADEHDKATFGNTFRVVLAEDMAALEEIGWAPVAADVAGDVDRDVDADVDGDVDGPSSSATPAFSRHDDVLTMARLNSGAIVGSVFGSTPEEIVPYLGDGLARIAGWDLTHVHGLGHHQFRPLLVLSPILARTIARAGWSKDDLRRALFEHARIPARRFERLIGEWSNLTPGRRTLAELAAGGHVPAVFAESDDPDRLVPVVADPSAFVIAVAGDPDRTNAYVFSNDGPHGDWTTKRIDLAYSDDLVCRVP